MSGYPRPCEFSLHIGSFHFCAFFVSCVFRRASVVFPGRILISFGFSDLPRAPPPLCDHGLEMFDKTVNVRQQYTRTTTWTREKHPFSPQSFRCEPESSSKPRHPSSPCSLPCTPITLVEHSTAGRGIMSKEGRAVPSLPRSQTNRQNNTIHWNNLSNVFLIYRLKYGYTVHILYINNEARKPRSAEPFFLGSPPEKSLFVGRVS